MPSNQASVKFKKTSPLCASCFKEATKVLRWAFCLSTHTEILSDLKCVFRKVWVAGFWMRSRECEADARKERVSVRLWKDSRCPDELWRKRPYFHFCCWSWSSRTGQLSQRSTKRTRHPMTPSVLTHLEATLAWPFEILWGSSWLGGTEVQSCHIWLCPVNLSSLTYWNPFLVKWMFFGDLIDSL